MPGIHEPAVAARQPRVGDLAAGAAAGEKRAAVPQPVERRAVSIAAPALADDRPVRLEPEGCQRPQDLVRGAGNLARRVEVIHAHQPLAAARARVGPTADRRDQRAEVERAGGRGREAAAIGGLRRSDHERGRTLTKVDPRGDSMQARTVTRFAGLAALAFLAGCAGEPPAELGVRDGRLAPCKPTPNCVASQADRAADPGHYVPPLAIRGEPEAAWAALVAAVRATPRVQIVAEGPGYLHAEYASRVFGFVDDVELQLDPSAKLVHVRSASRLGRSDFGVNRARIEALRTRLAAAGVLVGGGTPAVGTLYSDVISNTRSLACPRSS